MTKIKELDSKIVDLAISTAEFVSEVDIRKDHRDFKKETSDKFATLGTEIDDKIGNSREDIERELKEYADLSREALELQLELQDKALRGELNSQEAQLLQNIENLRREQQRKLDELSEGLTTDIDDLKDRVTKETEDVLNAIDNIQGQINALPTNVELTEVQLENLRYLLNSVEAEFADINYKISLVLRDQFLPAEEKPALEALQLSARQTYVALETVITQALADKVLTEEEKLAINNNLENMRAKTVEINNKLIEMYDLIGQGIVNMVEDQILESIVAVQLIVEYSPNQDTGWHAPPYLPTDIYMRQKNGEFGNWYGPIRIRGEGGVSSFKSSVFTRSVTTPTTPIGGTYASPLPTTTGWFDGIPNGTDPVFISTRIFTETGVSPQQAVWTTPQMVGDTPEIDYEFSSVASNPGNPTANPANWYNDATVDSIWMAVRTKTKGVWGAWDISKIKGEDGVNGVSSFKSSVFTRSTSTPAIPTGGSYASPVPTTAGWTDGVPSGTNPVYITTRIFTATGASPQQATWTAPQMVGDTPEIDYEFSDLTGNPGNPTDNPANWYNDAKESSVWMAIRTKTKGVWGTWDVSKIKGEDGVDGITAFKSSVFIKSATKPAVPVGGSFTSPKPTTAGWSDGVPDGNLPTYISSRTFTSTGAAPQQATWSDPSILGDTADLDYEFSTLATNPGNPTANPANWTNTATSATIWMALRKRINGVWSSWEISKIKGESGADGQYRDYQFAKNTSIDTPPTSGWTDTPPTTSATEYLWQRSGLVIPPATTPSYWTAVRLTGPPGMPGAPASGSGATISSTEPSPKTTNMVWIDTSVRPIEQKYWNGSIWVLIGVSQADMTLAIKDANDALKKTMEDALADGIISNNEAQLIADNISTMNALKRTLDEKYTSLYNDPFVSTATKTDIRNKKTDFDTKHTALLNACITISRKTSVTAAEVADYNTKQTAYNTSLTNLSKALEDAQNEVFINGIDRIEVGGRNLLLKSGIKVTNSSYNIRNYNLVSSHTFKNGDDYIVTIWGSLGAGKSDFRIFNSGGVIQLGRLEKVDNGLYRCYFKWTNTQGDITTTNTVLHVYAIHSKVTASSTIDRIKLEKGTNPSDWTPAHEDQQEEIDTAITNAAQAKNIADAANNKVNFLTATSDPNTGLITGGALLVGDAVGNNAGVVGVTDKGDESVRFYAGSAYNQKNVAPFRVENNGKFYASNAFIQGNVIASSGFFGGFEITTTSFKSSNGAYEVISSTGMQILRDRNGVVRNRKGLDDNGQPMDTWYDENGNEVFTLSDRGLVYVQFVSESYRRIRMLYINNASTDPTVAQIRTAINTNAYYKQLTGINTNTSPTSYYAVVTGSNGNYEGFSYSAGNNQDSGTNKRYEGYLYSSEIKTGSYINNGWYITDFTVPISNYDFNVNASAPDSMAAIKRHTFNIAYYVGGKVSRTISWKAQYSVRPETLYIDPSTGMGLREGMSIDNGSY